MSSAKYTLLTDPTLQLEVDERGAPRRQWCGCQRFWVISLLITLLIAATLSVGALLLKRAEEPYARSGSQASGNYPQLDWWKRYPVYQIYPRSFQDSDGDGIGDLKGIQQRVSYLDDLGIKAIWLSPIFKSPMKDFGYDVSDYRAIDPIFGTMQDFKALLQEVHSREMYLILDFVPNHSSEEHEWFEKSLQNIAPYDDYYVWVDGRLNETTGELQPINNWVSEFRGPAWNCSNARNQCYLHKFLYEQPDLNYRNAALKAEMAKTLEFWMKLGVDGFRIDALQHLVEDARFRNESRDPRFMHSKPDEYTYLLHNYTLNQPETYKVVTEWAELFIKFGHEQGKHIFSVGEMDWVSTIGSDMKYYKTGIDLPFNFDLLTLTANSTPADMRRLIEHWMKNMPAGKWPNWVVGNHDNNRIATKLASVRYTDAVNALLLLLPGTPTCYYGDEIGMTDVFVPFNETQDPAGKLWGPKGYQKRSRDPERTPMQWSSGQNAGFSAAPHTWLPIAANYTKVNVDEQLNDRRSHLSVFKRLLQLRLERTFQADGENLQLHNGSAISDDLLAFSRNCTDQPTFLVVLNFGRSGQNAANFVLSSIFADAANATVAFTTGSLQTPKEGSKVGKDAPIKLNSGQGIVLKFSRA